MIPRLLHFIWLGLGPVPEVLHGWVARWHELNSPDGWEVVLWTDDTGLEILSPWTMVNRHSLCCGPVLRSRHTDLLSRACHLAQRSNIWRYAVVERYGGVYLDTDVEPRRPVGNVLDNLEAFAVPHLDDPTYLANSAFGAVPGHPWVRDLVDKLPTRDPATSLSMGSLYLTETTARHPGVTKLDPLVFHHDMNPWTVQSGLRGSFNREYPPPTVGVHHFAGYWHKGGFVPIRKPGDES